MCDETADGARDDGVAAAGANPSTTDVQVVVVTDPELDLLTSPALDSQLSAAVTSGPRVLVVDMSDVRFMGVAGVTVLLRRREQAEGRGVRVCLAGCPDAVVRLLALTDADGLLPRYDSAAAAVRDHVQRATGPGADLSASPL